MPNWVSSLRHRSLAVRTTVLGLATLATWLITAPVAAHLGGAMAVAASAVAAMLCLVGAVIALVIAHMLRQPQSMLTRSWPAWRRDGHTVWCWFSDPPRRWPTG